MRNDIKKTNKIVLVVAALLGILFLIPLLWMFFTSFKTLSEALTSPGLIPRQWTLQNFREVFASTVDAPIFRWLFNTALVTAIGTVLVAFIDVLAAYALARLDLPMKNIFLSIIVMALTIPGIVTIFPSFFLFRNFGLIDSYIPLILPYTASVMGVYLIYNFLRSFPKDLEEAATIDGASRWQILRHVVFPAIRPVVASLSIITFLAIYNDFLWPSLVTNQAEMKTITVGIATLIQGANFVNPARLMASTLIATVPALIIFLYANKFFVRGVTNTGIK